MNNLVGEFKAFVLVTNYLRTGTGKALIVQIRFTSSRSAAGATYLLSRVRSRGSSSLLASTSVCLGWAGPCPSLQLTCQFVPEDLIAGTEAPALSWSLERDGCKWA